MSFEEMTLCQLQQSTSMNAFGIEFVKGVLGNIFIVLGVLIGILLVLKLYALIYHIIWIRINGDKCMNNFVAALAKWQITGVDTAEYKNLYDEFKVLFSHDDWPLHRLLFGNTPPGRTRIVGWLFSLPVLVVLEFFILCFSPDLYILYAGVWLLWLNLTASFIQTLYSRVKLGYIDGFLRRTTISRKPLTTEEILSTRHTYLKDSIVVYFGVACMLALGYAGIFLGIQKASGFTAFHGLNNTAWAPFDSLFLSFVTQATVGYGDMYPKTEAARFFVMSHMAVVGSLVAFLLFSLGATANLDDMIEEWSKAQKRANINKQPPVITRRKCGNCGKRRKTNEAGYCSQCADTTAVDNS